MKCCVMCGEPMHRFGFPQDADGHEPSATACINGLRGRLEKLEGAFREAQDEGQPECRNEAECGRLHDDIHRTWHRREAITQEEERK